ncbi:hypothetical protein [Bacillus sp. T33-2]|uniref:hypothetical protein n=1 Tax=Bacillus sp. T33-2 TaxID=2054168 RepID=UPI000C769F51|nr:hypothetical protein [Bacillus sp. T33-2]PLR89074.1 hypothetical protein CVD19_24090 [Bacillus sp. T33-2]
MAVIEQEDGFASRPIGDLKNDWNLALTDEIPIELQVNSGASDTQLDLQGMQLANLEVKAGVDDIEIDLRGDSKKSFDVKLQMSVGESTIILPEDVGVKITSEKGIPKVMGSTSTKHMRMQISLSM